MIRLEEFEFSPRWGHVVMQMVSTAAALVSEQVDKAVQVGEEMHGRHFRVASMLK